MYIFYIGYQLIASVLKCPEMPVYDGTDHKFNCGKTNDLNWWLWAITVRTQAPTCSFKCFLPSWVAPWQVSPISMDGSYHPTKDPFHSSPLLTPLRPPPMLVPELVRALDFPTMSWGGDSVDDTSLSYKSSGGTCRCLSLSYRFAPISILKLQFPPKIS